MKRLSFLPLILVASPAFAHVGMDGAQHHFAAGFSHPFGGMDHCLAMIAVGLVAASLGGRARFILPLAFLSAMLAGFLVGAGQVFVLPAYEAMIVASVIGLGLALLVAKPIPTMMTMAIVPLFGFAHGFAHGIEGALNAQYATGFLLATAILHAIGIGAGLLAAWIHRPVFYQIAGGAIAVVGLALAVA